MVKSIITATALSLVSLGVQAQDGTDYCQVEAAFGSIKPNGNKKLSWTPHWVGHSKSDQYSFYLINYLERDELASPEGIYVFDRDQCTVTRIFDHKAPDTTHLVSDPEGKQYAYANTNDKFFPVNPPFLEAKSAEFLSIEYSTVIGDLIGVSSTVNSTTHEIVGLATDGRIFKTPIGSTIPVYSGIQLPEANSITFDEVTNSYAVMVVDPSASFPDSFYPRIYSADFTQYEQIPFEYPFKNSSGDEPRFEKDSRFYGQQSSGIVQIRNHRLVYPRKIFYPIFSHETIYNRILLPYSYHVQFDPSPGNLPAGEEIDQSLVGRSPTPQVLDSNAQVVYNEETNTIHWRTGRTYTMPAGFRFDRVRVSPDLQKLAFHNSASPHKLTLLNAINSTIHTIDAIELGHSTTSNLIVAEYHFNSDSQTLYFYAHNPDTVYKYDLIENKTQIVYRADTDQEVWGIIRNLMPEGSDYVLVIEIPFRPFNDRLEPIDTSARLRSIHLPTATVETVLEPINSLSYRFNDNWNSSGVFSLEVSESGIRKLVFLDPIRDSNVIETILNPSDNLETNQRADGNSDSVIDAADLGVVLE